jgi:hypothetical protein
MKIKTYMSDPEWSSSFIGKFIYIYKSKGTLEWNDDRIVYVDKKRKIEIQKNSIKQLGLGNYSRAAKPIRLDYIEIVFENDKFQNESLFFTPIIPNSNPWFTPVWQTDKYLKECLEEIKKWRHS